MVDCGGVLRGGGRRAGTGRALSPAARPRQNRAARPAAPSGLVPALDVREVGQVDLVPRVAPGPAEDREVGDATARRRRTRARPGARPSRRTAGASRPCSAPGRSAGRPRLSSAMKWCTCPGIGPKPPIWNISHSSARDAPHRVGGHERAGLLGQVDQDRARLEDADRLAARARRGSTMAGILLFGLMRTKSGACCSPLRDVDHVHVVGQAHLFERDADLAAVGGVEGVQLDRQASSLPARWRRGAASAGWPAVSAIRARPTRSVMPARLDQHQRGDDQQHALPRARRAEEEVLVQPAGQADHADRGGHRGQHHRARRRPSAAATARRRT